MNVSARALDVLGQAIVAGRYPPGSAVPPEPLLCDELGVSRTVVREAIKSLVAKGLLSTGPKVGTRVRDPEQWNWFDPHVVAWQGRAGHTREFLRDLQELRRLVEPAAVRMAAERATPDDIAQIEAAYAGMADAIDHGGDYVAHDLAFHQGLLRASHNRMVVQVGKALSMGSAQRPPRRARRQLRRHRPTHRRAIDRPQTARLARRHAGRLGW